MLSSQNVKDNASSSMELFKMKLGSNVQQFLQAQRNAELPWAEDSPEYTEHQDMLSMNERTMNLQMMWIYFYCDFVLKNSSWLEEAAAKFEELDKDNNLTLDRNEIKASYHTNLIKGSEFSMAELSECSVAFLELMSTDDSHMPHGEYIVFQAYQMAVQQLNPNLIASLAGICSAMTSPNGDSPVRSKKARKGGCC